MLTESHPWPRTRTQSVEELLEAADAADEAAGLVVFNRTDAGRTLKAATKEKLIERLALTGADHGTQPHPGEDKRRAGEDMGWVGEDTRRPGGN